MGKKERLRNDVIQIRRAVILDLLSRGETCVSGISKKLNLPRTTVNRDIEYLKQESQKKLDRYIQDEIPFTYYKVLHGLNGVIRATHEILDDKSLSIRDKLQALQLLSTTYRGLLELTADGSIVQRAIEKVKQLEQQQKADTSDVTTVEEQTDQEEDIEASEPDAPVEEETGEESTEQNDE